MSLVKAVMKKYIKIPELSNFKNVLFIGPHPDDIEFGCGATIDKMVKKGSHIHFLIVTDGAGGTEDDKMSSEELRKIRKEEALNAAKFLGVETIDFLDFMDGSDYTVSDAIKKILPFVLKYKPEIIFAPDPNLKTECHNDHIKTGKAARAILNIISYPNILKEYGVDMSKYEKHDKGVFLSLYFSDKTNKLVPINKVNLNRKFEALKLHKSQMKDSEMMFTYFKFRAKELGFKCFKYGAEEYQVLHPLMEHVYSLGL